MRNHRTDASEFASKVRDYVAGTDYTLDDMPRYIVDEFAPHMTREAMEAAIESVR